MSYPISPFAEIRRQSGFTLVRMGQFVGCSPGAWQAYESGAGQDCRAMAERVAAVFPSVNTDDLESAYLEWRSGRPLETPKEISAAFIYRR